MSFDIGKSPLKQNLFSKPLLAMAITCSMKASGEAVSWLKYFATTCHIAILDCTNHSPKLPGEVNSDGSVCDLPYPKLLHGCGIDFSKPVHSDQDSEPETSGEESED